MLAMQQDRSFCDVLYTSGNHTHIPNARFLRSFGGIFEHGAGIATRNPCWHSLSAFRFHTAARRYVRSTSAASRRDAVRIGQLFISSSLCLPLKPASRIRLQIPSSKAFPHPYIPSPGPARTAQPSQKLREIPF